MLKTHSTIRFGTAVLGLACLTGIAYPAARADGWFTQAQATQGINSSTINARNALART